MEAGLPVGALVANRYRIERELGRGGMATVYLGRDERDGSSVAVKFLHPDLVARTAIARFTREIQIASQLKHPGILSVLDSGEENGVPYFTMPVVDGQTLQQLLASERQLQLPLAIDIAVQLTAALDHAHAQGVIHRDIKPSNILLSGNQVLLADFGVARAMDASSADRLTETGATVGTAHYMSPEQASADKLDGRSDIYSLACVLYEMLAGTPPFTGPSTQAILARHAVDPVPRIRTVRNSVNNALSNVIERALAKTPADRYQSAAAFGEALRVAETTPDAPVAVPQSARRKPPVAMIAGIATVAIAMVATIFAITSRKNNGPLDPNRVVGFPLQAPSAVGGAAGAGEDVATMIGSALDRRGALRWVDGWKLLSAGQQNSGAKLESKDLRAIARAHHAAYYVTGRVILRPDSADVLLELVDVASDSVVLRPRASGSSNDLWRASIRAVNQLLPRLVPGGEARDLAADWVTRDPSAVASFLAAEAAFRRAQPAKALTLYRAAVQADTLFALAAVRGAQAAVWDHRPDEATALVRAAVGRQMSAPYAHFVRGFEAYLAGIPDSASNEFRRATALDPELTAAWTQLGETYIHLVPSGANPDSVAADAFARARALDSTATNILLHPIEIRLRSGDAAGAAPLVKQFMAARPDADLAAHVQLNYDCVRNGALNVKWSEAVRANAFAVLSVGAVSSGHGGSLPCAAAAFGAVIDFDTVSTRKGLQAERQSAQLGLVSVMVAQGRSRDAAEFLVKSIARGDGGSLMLLLASSVDSLFNAEAADVARKDTARFGGDFARCSSTERCAALALYAGAHSNLRGAVAVAKTLEARIISDTSQVEQRLIAATAAHALLARGDSAGARTLFKSLLALPLTNRSSITWDPNGALGAERLVYARLLFAHGEHAAARAVANGFDAAAPASFPLYLRASLELRVRIASALGDATGAAAYRSRLVALAPTQLP